MNVDIFFTTDQYVAWRDEARQLEERYRREELDWRRTRTDPGQPAALRIEAWSYEEEARDKREYWKRVRQDLDRRLDLRADQERAVWEAEKLLEGNDEED